MDLMLIVVMPLTATRSGQRMDILTYGRKPLLTTLLALSVLLTACSSILPKRARFKLVFLTDITKHTSVDKETRRIQDAADLVSEDFKPFFIRTGDIYFPEVELEYPLRRIPNTSLTLHLGGTRSITTDEDSIYSILPFIVRTSTHASFFEGGAGIRHYIFENNEAKLSLIVRLTVYHYRINQSITIAGIYNYHRDINGEGLEIDLGFGGEVNNKHPWFSWLPEKLALGLDTTYSRTIVSDLGNANRWSISLGAIYSFGKW